MMNNQPPRSVEKQVTLFSSNDVLLVHSIFHTIQGEGPFSGTPALFLRLAGCNLQCPKCDTDYTSVQMNVSISGIIDDLLNYRNHFPKTNLVVITGGEPFRQRIFYLTKLLLANGFWVQIESNGTLPLQGIHCEKNIAKRKGVYLVVSPKTAKIHRQALAAACAFKYVVSSKELTNKIGLPDKVLGMSLDVNNKYPVPREDALVYIQPESSHDNSEYIDNLTKVVDICLEHGHILSLQIHKIIGVE